MSRNAVDVLMIINILRIINIFMLQRFHSFYFLFAFELYFCWLGYFLLYLCQFLWQNNFIFYSWLDLNIEMWRLMKSLLIF